MGDGRRPGGLLGALRERLRARGRLEAADASREPASAAPDATAAERLDDALAGLRERIPEPGQEHPASDHERPPASSD